MKFDVQIPSLSGIARLEIKTAQEESLWAAYIAFAGSRSADEACLVLGQSGIPYRFTGAAEKEAKQRAKKFLEQNYEVVKMIW